MTAAKIMDIISRLPGYDGQAADAVSAYTQVKMEDAHKLLKIPRSECADIWIRLPRQLEHPPCEIIQQQSKRYNHQSNGGAERMVQTIRNQIKANKIQFEKNSGITITADSPLVTWLPRHAAWQYTRFHKRQDSTTTAYEKIRHMSYQSPILLVGEAVACLRPGALVNKLESAWLEGIWLGRDSKTDKHLIGAPNGMVRSVR